MPGVPGTPEDADPVDPLTNESIMADWDATVVIAVVLDPVATPPAGSARPAPTPAGPAAQPQPRARSPNPDRLDGQRRMGHIRKPRSPPSPWLHGNCPLTGKFRPLRASWLEMKCSKETSEVASWKL